MNWVLVGGMVNSNRRVFILRPNEFCDFNGLLEYALKYAEKLKEGDYFIEGGEYYPMWRLPITLISIKDR